MTVDHFWCLQSSSIKTLQLSFVLIRVSFLSMRPMLTTKFSRYSKHVLEQVIVIVIAIEIVIHYRYLLFCVENKP